MPEISLISPVYKAEAYLARCLDSVLTQTFTDWELVMVVDGSPDSSAAIAEAYAAQDARVRVIHQENRGVSAARQTGLEAATGTYVIHIDPDDWVEPEMLQELHDKALEEEADVVICDYFVTNTRGENRLVTQRPSGLSAEAVLRDLFRHLHGSCWNKLVRRSCLTLYGVRFPEGINYCEDLLTWVQLFQHDDISVSYLPKAFYHYVQHEGGITRAYTRKTYDMRQLYQFRMETLLPGERFAREIRLARLSIFSEAFIHGALSRGEAWLQAWKNLRGILQETHSIRWFAIYACLLLACSCTARFILNIHR